MLKDKPKSSSLGGRVAYAIEQSGQTVKAVSKRLMISEQSIYGWISGATKNIRNESLFDFADVTGFNPRWVATGEGPEKKPIYDDKRIHHALKVMESLPDYAIDQIIKNIDSVANLVNRATSEVERH